MEKIINLNNGWEILQDVHDTGEQLKLYEKMDSYTTVGSQISEWEPLQELKHLQLLYAKEPYFGRELRYFNQAPWWYRQVFEVKESGAKTAEIRFSNVDYYAKVWLNGVFLGEHEGYSAPFSFDVRDCIREGKNLLVVKVSSPWDDRVELDEQEQRTNLVIRNMVKGTYEHSDTFIQRDVNPIGIYGKVEVILSKDGILTEDPEITYTFENGLADADTAVSSALKGLTEGEEYELVYKIKEKESGICRAGETYSFKADSETMRIEKHFQMKNINLWSTWDHGTPWMYTCEAALLKGKKLLSIKASDFAFRKTEIERTEEVTRFWINEKKFYVRGTSYFPDCYISAMTKERYFRDLLNIKAAGFNLIRVHVHTEQKEFYDLCDEMGLAVLQDSEYNWSHPSTDEWADRFTKIYRDNVKMLKNHPSIICWIIMNEPGCIDPDGKTRERFMEENPGPRLYREVTEMDPARPIIKGSFCETDPYSGDSHNYLGSLSGGEYREIYEQREKLNTEYGFDAPGCAENLKKVPSVYNRLRVLADQIPEIQDYQYKLIKYYTEHYRIQKYNRCSGYVQFMFIDLCPQSFYGIYDWWGIPKKGLEAILESNGQIGIFVEHRDVLRGIWAVNDSCKSYTGCTVEWTVMEGETVIEHHCEKCDIGPDSCIHVADFPDEYGKDKHWNVFLTLTDSEGNCIARNKYEDIQNMLPRVKGHPERMSHEYGMRLYWA